MIYTPNSMGRLTKKKTTSIITNIITNILSGRSDDRTKVQSARRGYTAGHRTLIIHTIHYYNNAHTHTHILYLPIYTYTSGGGLVLTIVVDFYNNVVH